jgi:hypothetical protein
VRVVDGDQQPPPCAQTGHEPEDGVCCREAIGERAGVVTEVEHARGRRRRA